MQNSDKTYSTVASHWDVHTKENFTGETFWLGHAIVQQRYQKLSIGRKEYQHWLNYSLQHYFGKEKPLRRILSIGCGEGALERHAAMLAPDAKIDGIDLSPKSVETARDMAVEQGLGNRINYIVANAETDEFGLDKYDAIVFNSSLHHLSEFDLILQRCKKALTSYGKLFVNEYIGPNRFDFPDKEKQAMSATFNLIPEKYRISRSIHDAGILRNEVLFPDPKQVAEVDPSEAINSEQIVDAINRNFNIIENNFAGGSLLHLVLNDIVGNFVEDDAESLAILNMLFEIEETLVKCGHISPHFAYIAASKNST